MRQQTHINTPYLTGEQGWLSILRQYWGYNDFRSIQLDIIKSIASGKDTLGLMPTGGGKSITFQVPAMSMDGVCIVITPLISLMKDQVDNLRHRGIPSYAIYSGISHTEIVQILDNCIYGQVKFLYVSPERLSSPIFLTKITHVNVCFITVDEAHCISQWGYDFRPAYLNIASLRELFPDRAILALTATATLPVVDDICKRLAFREGSHRFRMSFKRDNLSYIVRHTNDIYAEIVHILNSVPGTAIVYTMSRKRTKEIADMLTAQGISASYYHAGLDYAVKTKRQSDWQQGTTRVIVATNAFGMGIDKSDVRLVIHADVPTAVEAYFQEAGRGGRDGKRSYAVLLVGPYSTSTMKQRLGKSFPSKDFVRDVYEHLAYYYEIGVGMGAGMSFIFPQASFCHQYHYDAAHVDAAMHILDRAGYIEYTPDGDNRTKMRFIIERDDLYRLCDLSPQEDALIDAVMRLYTGTFSEFAYIDEALISQFAKIPKENIYMLLSELRRKGIIRFIPPRTNPFVTYAVNRVDGCDVVISKDVYDALRDNMEKQINAMVAYIDNDTVCRQRQLLNYFGEESTDDSNCGNCEVCIANNKRQRSATTANATDQGSSDVSSLITSIKAILADNKVHHLTELYQLTKDRAIINTLITQLCNEEVILLTTFGVKTNTTEND